MLGGRNSQLSLFSSCSKKYSLWGNVFYVFLMIYEDLILTCSVARLVKRIVDLRVHNFVIPCGAPIKIY